MNSELKSKLSALEESITGMRIDVAPLQLKELLGEGVSPDDILMSLKRGMEAVGNRYEQGEYFLSDLVMSGEVMKQCLATLEPPLKSRHIRNLGTTVLGTVRGDIHDIGKNVFKILAESAGFSVIDIGVDANPEVFVDAVKKNDARILGASCLLSATREHITELVDTLTKARIRERVKMVVGGAPITNDYAKKVGADAGTNSAVEGLRIYKRLLDLQVP